VKIDNRLMAWGSMKSPACASLLLGVLTLPAFFALMAADSPVYVENRQVLDNFGKQGGNPLVPGDAYRVQTDRRTANGNIEIHEKETDIFYIIDGSATIVVGGTAIDPRPTRPGQMTAKDIQNGQTYNLKKGDVLVIPAGQPHWFKQVNGFINYLTVKSVKQ
jgi:mannose-6-phosphate isomerase-like protein (cupin superfamily)